EVLSVDNAAILLLEDGDTLAVRAAKGLDEQEWRGFRIPLGEGFAGRVAVERQTLALHGAGELERVSPGLREFGLSAVMAAPLIGALRDALRAAALEGDDAARATDRVDRLFQSRRTAGDAIATALFAVLGPGGTRLDFASAGHPPPLLVQPDGSTRFLEGGLSTPLGVSSTGARRAAHAP